MTCFEWRSRLMSEPRARSFGQHEHLRRCRTCSRLADELAALDREIRTTTRVPVPEGLAERIVLAQTCRARLPIKAAAAAAALAVVTAALVALALDSAGTVFEARAVGPHHPAVTAISIARREPPPRAEMRTPADTAAARERLGHVGLTLSSKDVSARYVGTCEMAAGRCDHLVLSTPEGDASVFLMPDERSEERVLIADGPMTALLSPAPAGAYILVAQSPKALRRAQKLLVHG